MKKKEKKSRRRKKKKKGVGGRRRGKREEDKVEEEEEEERNFNTFTIRAEIFAVVLFSRISRVKPSQKFPLQFMSIYSNDNITKIAKLTTRKLPHLAKTAKITVHENNGVYSSTCMYSDIKHSFRNWIDFSYTLSQNKLTKNKDVRTAHYAYKGWGRLGM